MIKKPAKPKRARRGHPTADMPPAIDKIRNAALMLFSRQGYEGTSIAEIATLAGVAKPLIHYHFSSKEELWYSVIDEASGTLLKGMEAFRTAAIGLPPEQVIALLEEQASLTGAALIIVTHDKRLKDRFQKQITL